jgi:hypothetical protein
MKKYPKENSSLLLLIISISIGICVCILIAYLIYSSIHTQHISQKVIIKPPSNENNYFQNLLNYPYNNLNKDIVLNPYAPPLRDERYLITDNLSFPNGRIPINISTNVGAVETPYRQLGILTPLNGSSKDNILPLMGKPLFTNRNMWNYYTTGNQHNNIKLPVSRKGKSCTNEYGCDKLYNGDTIYIEGINEAYRVTEYDNDTIRYLPFY